MQLPMRWIRGALVLLLLAELLCTLPWPWSSLPHPAWRMHEYRSDTVYESTALLQRTQGHMKYDQGSKKYSTPPLAIWYSPSGLFSSQPAAGLAAWLDLLTTAKHPWASYWLFAAAPQGLRVMPEQMQQELNLLQAGLPVMVAYSSAHIHFAAPERWLLRKLNWQPSAFLPPAWVVCTAAVNATTLQPGDAVLCRRYQGQPGDRHGNREDGMFRIRTDSSTAARRKAQPAAGTCRFLGPGLILGPMGRLISSAARQWRPTAVLLQVLRQLWRGVVPTGGLSRPFCPLLEHLHLLSYDYPVTAYIMQTLVLVVNARNWVYLITVAYKISRRLALLAPAPLPARLSGVALTFVGMFLGLWQTVGYAVIDTMFDIVLYKAVCCVLKQSGLAALVVWWLWKSFLAELRIGVRTWQLLKLVFKEARMLVLAPQALLLQQAALVDRVPRRQVPTVGSWPAPLVIPEEVDELPVSEVPRGFICPITQAIMRQPALLLHDRTIAPSTYDKEAISQWLAEHSSDPKNPGVPLSMKTVKLVYNGDLGRSIEDWVTSTRQQQERQQQQQTGLAAWRRALSGHLEGHPLQLEGLAGEGMAAAAAGVLMHMRENMGGASGPGAAAAAAGDVGAAAHAAAARGETGSILSGAGALVRTSSAAIAQVASMDLPAVAVAGIHQLAGTTRRITTRALTRQQQQQQREGRQSAADGPQQQQEQQGQRLRRRRRVQQQQHEEEGDSDINTDSDRDGSGSASTGSSSEVDSRRPGRARRAARARQHHSSDRDTSPDEQDEQEDHRPRRRAPRSRSQPAAAAAGAGSSGLR